MYKSQIPVIEQASETLPQTQCPKGIASYLAE